MTTGTAGNDRLSNDRDIQHELVDALGGNDIISIAPPNFDIATVTVDGGAGSDNLVMNGVTVTGAQVTGAQAGTFSLRNGGGTGSYSVGYSGIETTILTAVLHGSGRLDGGDSVDIWDLGASTANSNWSIWTGAASDAVKLSGSFANAVVVTQSGNDSLNLEGVTGGSIGAYGGTGNDSYRIGAHPIEIHEFADEGDDMVLTARATYVLPANVETLSPLSGGDKHFTGNDSDNLIQTFGGNDHLFGLGGNDRLLAGGGDDRIDGGDGIDTAEFVGGAYGIVLNLTDMPVPVVGRPDTGRPVGPNEALDGSGGIDTLVSIEIYKLTGHADYAYGSSRGERFDTLGGNDRIEAGGGDDHIEGGDGNDYVDGGAGSDMMIGGLGYDIFVVDDPGDEILEHLNQGPDEVRTALPVYALAVANVENLTGLSDAGQTLDGNDYANLISGGAGDDVLNGRNGDDSLHGNAGSDILIGLAGFDYLAGGAGDDIYAIDAGDTIFEDFGAGTDEVRTVATIFTLQQNLENLRATSDIGHLFRGNLGPNGIIGGNGNDLILLQDGGGDVVYALGGDDLFFYGGAFDQYDWAHGGDGKDSLILQGHYGAGILFGDQPQGNISGIETIRLLASADGSYGGAGAGPFSYSLTMRDTNVAPGAAIAVDARGLASNETLTFDASAETASAYTVHGGAGNDLIRTGGGSDVVLLDLGGHDSVFGGASFDKFHFGAAFDSSDRVDGGPDAGDYLILRGDYSAGLVFTDNLTSVDEIWLLSGITPGFIGDFGPPPGVPFSYKLKSHDGNVSAGAIMWVNADLARTTETLTFDGSAETDGRFSLNGGLGADTLIAGAGADVLKGNGGGDRLTGGGGADTFLYSAAFHSEPGSADRILDFEPGVDKIDLRGIDTDPVSISDGAFHFIGASDFGGHAGELRAYQISATEWRIEGLVDRGMEIDLLIEVVVPSGQIITIDDFVL